MHAGLLNCAMNLVLGTVLTLMLLISLPFQAKYVDLHTVSESISFS